MRITRKLSASFLISFGCSFLMVAIAWAASTAHASSLPVAQTDSENCTSCHGGIEDIVDPNSGMGVSIQSRGECTVCHGGDPGALDAEEAHGPEGEFFPDPGSPWIVEQTCGTCHPGYGYTLERSLMNTEAGKIQGNLWAWGVQRDQVARYGNYTIVDNDGLIPIFGSEKYKAYMESLSRSFTDQFRSGLEQLPRPTVEEIIQDPSLAAYTYSRNQCQRCHTGVPGRERRGDYRGMGCSACHIPYSNDGFYEGADATIPDEAGHLLVHRLQATRETSQGIPVETCVTCHNRGKRIGVSFEGIMEFPYGTPFSATASTQVPLHTKKYLFIKDDHHHDPISREGNPEGGMLCQDCHTSLEMHGDGNIFGTTLAQVEIECSDCHGTPDFFPWELPLGFGEENFLDELPVEARGTTTELQPEMAQGTFYNPEDGYLVTARGNPFGNVIRRGDEVVLHSATGRDYIVPTLKGLSTTDGWKSQDAQVAMENVEQHVDQMECYACHADWAPQCYGCHVASDYSDGKTGTDWVAIGNAQNPDGTVDLSLVTEGKISEGRGYLRWESPILGINGEGRVTPIIPGCQVVYTVIGPDGESIALNQIGRTPPNTEGAGPEGQRGMDMAPAQPHTISRNARRCESCHNDPKALGYGVDGGIYLLGYTQDQYVDLRDAEGNVLPSNSTVQMPAIQDLPMDWAQVVDPETGEQMMTIGSHWPGSGPLSADQRLKMERVGLCMGCHENMDKPDFWTDVVVAKYGEILANEDHIEHMNHLLQDAVGGDVDDLDVNVAMAEVKNLQAELARANMELEKVEQVPEPTPKPDLLLIALSLVVGLIVGGGILFAVRERLPGSDTG